MHIQEQIRSGRLRCVQSHEALRLEGGELRAGAQRYPMLGEVPIILKDSAAIAALLDANPEMEKEYFQPTFYQRLRKLLYKEYDSKAYRDAFDEFIRSRPPGDLVLEVGGGPTRGAPHLTNLNIGPFPNVDIVGDAHDLPYMDGAVDAVTHGAVIEHLRDPVTAVREMRRVLKPGGYLLSSIPFMQAYHGYPDHYQNFTLSGHKWLYESNGFNVVRVGVGHGPITALATLNARFALEYFPPVLNQVFGRLLQGVGIALRPLDRLLETRESAHFIASTTFVLARKE